MADARGGVARTKAGDPFKPGTLRAYDQAFRLRVLPALGNGSFYRLARRDVQDLVDRLVAAGVAPATINTAVGALGALYGRAVHRDLATSPTVGVRAPAARATPAEAERLLAAVPDRDRAVWATAMYAGLRRGELRALTWDDVDLRAGTIDVLRSWDPAEPRRGRRRAATAVGYPRRPRCASTWPPRSCASRPHDARSRAEGRAIVPFRADCLQ
jgi:integrase